MRVCYTPEISESTSLAIAKAVRPDNLQLDFSDSAFEASIFTRKLWRSGTTISISFMNGTTVQQNNVKLYAKRWLEHVNLKFQWVNSGGMIRIRFGNNGSWSYLGTDALGINSRNPTMEFGWLDEKVILHEFGHMLGFNHTHLSKNFPYTFNRDAVIRSFGGPPNNWSVQQIERNILNPPRDELTETPYDVGIMNYYFPKELIRENVRIEPGLRISKSEIELAKLAYPSETVPNKELTPINQWIRGTNTREYVFRLDHGMFCYIKISIKNRYRIYINDTLTSLQYLSKGTHRLRIVGTGNYQFMIRNL